MEPLGSETENKGVRADVRLIESVGEHVKKTIGPIDGVFHEDHSTEVHVDVFCVSSAEDRPFQTLVTAGAATRAMRPPRGGEQFTHLELAMFLPYDWNLSEPAPEDTWPIQALRSLARYPHRNATWLWGGHTVPLGYQAAGAFIAGVLTRPYLLSPESGRIRIDRQRRAELFSLVPLYAEEFDFVRKNGDRALIDHAERADRFDELFIVTPGRDPFV